MIFILFINQLSFLAKAGIDRFFEPRDVIVAIFFLISTLSLLIQLIMLPIRVFNLKRVQFANEYTKAKRKMIRWITIFIINCTMQSCVWWYILRNWV